jgi:hypothetical protein
MAMVRTGLDPLTMARSVTVDPGRHVKRCEHLSLARPSIPSSGNEALIDHDGTQHGKTPF